MSFFRKIKDKIKEVGLTNELCEHLRQIGIEATVVDPKSPEAIHHTPTLGMFGNPPLGCVKVQGRNIDFVEVYRFLTGGDDNGMLGSIVYNYYYVVQADVGDREDELKADIRPITKGLFRKEVVGLECKGRGLGRLLNADSDLKRMLLEGRLLKFEIRPSKKDQYVRITPIVEWTAIAVSGVPVKYEPVVGRKAFPTREAFEAYDRIAQHIRSIVTARH